MKKFFAIAAAVLMLAACASIDRQYIVTVDVPPGWVEDDAHLSLPGRAAKVSRSFHDEHGGEIIVAVTRVAYKYDAGKIDLTEAYKKDRMRRARTTQLEMEKTGATNFEVDLLSVDLSKPVGKIRSWRASFRTGLAGEPKRGNIEAFLCTDAFGGLMEYLMILAYQPDRADMYDSQRLASRMF